jgi:hypothetical protein
LEEKMKNGKQEMEKDKPKKGTLLSSFYILHFLFYISSSSLFQTVRQNVWPTQKPGLGGADIPVCPLLE